MMGFAYMFGTRNAVFRNASFPFFVVRDVYKAHVIISVMWEPLINDCSAWCPNEVVPDPVSKNTGAVATA
jgi:hypothetical protein